MPLNVEVNANTNFKSKIKHIPYSEKCLVCRHKSTETDKQEERRLKLVKGSHSNVTEGAENTFVAIVSFSLEIY